MRYGYLYATPKEALRCVIDIFIQYVKEHIDAWISVSNA